jgi:hypothetical protein
VDPVLIDGGELVPHRAIQHVDDVRITLHDGLLARGRRGRAQTRL